MSLNTLSGRFALLTGIFVLLAEVADPFALHLEVPGGLSAIAAGARPRSPGWRCWPRRHESMARISKSELLDNAGVFNVVLRRDDVRQLVLSSPIPRPISATYDLRDSNPSDLDR